MYCLKNVMHTKMPNDVVKSYCTLYQFIGRNATMLETLEKDFEVHLSETIRLDTYFFTQLNHVSVSDSRFKQLLIKDSQPKTKSEHFIHNVKHAFKRVHTQTDTFNLFSTEIYDLLKFLYKNVEIDDHLYFAKTEKKKDKATNLLSSSHPTKREALDELNTTFKEAINKSDFEPAFLIANYYIDFINLKPFKKHNDVLGMMLLYILFLSYDFLSFHLSSFFELLVKQQEKLLKHTQEASHNWGEGLADIMPLHRFLMERLTESYQSVHELLRNYTYDKQTNKSDYIENTINKLAEIFTKQEIRDAHPTISDSTINRTLKRLRDTKKIRPLGKGRSAKWMKLYKAPTKNSLYEQIKFKV